MSDKEKAISVNDVTKIYKLYDKPTDRLKESLGLSKKKKYREHYALRNISFDIYKGECIGIIGTNGAGKSTILKIITGVLNPTAGNVEINGRISALLELGAGFNMEYSGIENIYLNGTMIGFSKEEIDAKLQDIIDFADIGEFVYQPVKTYSSGMFVRLAFAVAINIDPEILIVDEALSVGDVFFQSKCFRKFEEFKDQGKTILFVSHDLSSIQKYCSRAILLNKGEKIGEGTPGEIIDLYKKVLVGAVNDGNKAFIEESERKALQKAAESGEGEENASSDGRGNAVKSWKADMPINPNNQDYGDKQTEIVDFGIFDNEGKITSTIIKGTPFTIKVKIRANEDAICPIVAFTIRDLKGTDLCGTNTMFESHDIGDLKKGEERTITFSQKMDLHGSQYLLSLGCTRFDNDDFHVYHRLYDICSISVVADKNTVGFYDMNSEIVIE